MHQLFCPSSETPSPQKFTCALQLAQSGNALPHSRKIIVQQPLSLASERTQPITELVIALPRQYQQNAKSTALQSIVLTIHSLSHLRRRLVSSDCHPTRLRDIPAIDDNSTICPTSTRAISNFPRHGLRHASFSAEADGYGLSLRCSPIDCRSQPFCCQQHNCQGHRFPYLYQSLRSFAPRPS